MRAAIIATIIVVSLAQCRKPSAKDDGSADCIGAAGAKHAFVYLHGRDSRTPSEQEAHNRDVLRRLARENDARFAIARADTPCPDSRDDHHYLHEMTKRGARARTVHVEGAGHELVVEPLRDQLFLQTSTTD